MTRVSNTMSDWVFLQPVRMDAYIRTYVKYATLKLEAYSDLTGYSVNKFFNDASFQT